jgi:hypothetical protein
VQVVVNQHFEDELRRLESLSIDQLYAARADELGNEVSGVKVEASEEDVVKSRVSSYLNRIAASKYSDLTPTDAITHVIELINPATKPIRHRSRRIPFAAMGKFSAMIQEQLDAGLIVPSNSAWASPVNIVTKPDGTLRITIDYRKLNQITVKDAFPLPIIEQLIAKLRAFRIFSKFDCYSGFYQIKMEPESQQ